MPETVQEFRARKRLEIVPAWYPGYGHLALTSALGLLPLAWAISRVPERR